MKLFALLAALAVTASAFVVQLDVIGVGSDKCYDVGHSCEKDKQCCSNICAYTNADIGHCVASNDDTPPVCLPLGAPCMSPEECCSKVCPPSPSGFSKCLLGDEPGCSPFEAPCITDKDCCSEACVIPKGKLMGTCELKNNGNGDALRKTSQKKLSSPIPALKHASCSAPGTECKTNKDCCSDHCGYINGNSGFCLPSDHDAPKCLNLGATCFASQQCCSQICAVGPSFFGQCVLATDNPSCLSPESPCFSPSQCCSKVCGRRRGELIGRCDLITDDDNALQKTSLEASQKKLRYPTPALNFDDKCFPNGYPCITNEECCSDTCLPLPHNYGVCGTGPDDGDDDLSKNIHVHVGL